MSAQEKTEQPTATRLRKARERGDVAQSRDLTAGLLLGASVIMLTSAGPQLGRAFGATLARSAAAISAGAGPGVMLDLLGGSLAAAGAALAPLLAVLVGLSIAAPFLQTGPVLSSHPVKPALEKLNPLSDMKKMFFSLSASVELLKGVLKLIVVAGVCWAVVAPRMRDLVMLATTDVRATPRLVWSLAISMGLWVSLVAVGASALDLLYQKWQHRRNLRMTREEVQREYKQEEGDPTHKQARRELHREILQNAMLENIRTQADVVVTGKEPAGRYPRASLVAAPTPTSPDPLCIAVAIGADTLPDGNPDWPRLVAKGRGWLAQRILEIAREEGIPVEHDASLARALHEMEIGEQIPEELGQAVAAIFAWVEAVARARGELPGWERRAGPT